MTLLFSVHRSILASLSISVSQVLQKIIKGNKLKPGFAAFFFPDGADGADGAQERGAASSSSSF